MSREGGARNMGLRHSEKTRKRSDDNRNRDIDIPLGLGLPMAKQPAGFDKEKNLLLGSVIATRFGKCHH